VVRWKVKRKVVRDGKSPHEWVRLNEKCIASPKIWPKPEIPPAMRISYFEVGSGKPNAIRGMIDWENSTIL
jgi:hypothetical protein